MAYCGKCLHLDVCKTADSCDGHVPRCKHFLDKDEHPKLKHGQWIQIGYDKAMDRISCSCCKEYWNIADNNTEDFDYCPNCGAKMDGGNKV